jgi:hypothetical protein
MVREPIWSSTKVESYRSMPADPDAVASLMSTVRPLA